MKLHVIFIALLTAVLVSCASGRDSPQGSPAYSENSGTLDAAISSGADYFIPRLPTGAKVALIPFDGPSGGLSDYIFEELWNRFEDSDRFVMVDRRNLDRIEAEIKIQLESGRVDDDLAVSITKQYGAEILIYGQIAPLGGEYRMTVYATDVEKASSSQRTFTIRPDPRLSSLFEASPSDEIVRAVALMARSVGQKTTIAVGRISYADTQTVSSLSAWLKNRVIVEAQKQQTKFQVASEDESADFAVSSRGLTVETPVQSSPIQAIVTGRFSPLDKGAEVSLHLISTKGNREVLASAHFIIPASELERRKLSLLPAKGPAVISKTEFEEKQQAVDPYTGRNNRWGFTVSPDVLDGIYYAGDLMSIRVYAARDCYFRIIHVDVNGNAQVIYPTTAQDNNFIRAGETRRIPDNTRYRMSPPFGEELILAAAYDQAFTAVPISGGAGISAAAITRGMIVESVNRTSMNPLATAKFSYTILPKQSVP